MEMASWTIQKGPGHHHGILQPNTAHLGLSQNVVPIHWWITPSPFFLLKLPSGSIGKTWKNYSLFVFLLKYRMFKPNCPSTWHQNQVIPMSSIPHWANLFLKALLGGYRPSLLQRYPHMLITWLLHDYYIVVTRLLWFTVRQIADGCSKSGLNFSWPSFVQADRNRTSPKSEVKPCEGRKPSSHPQYCHTWVVKIIRKW